MKSGDVGKCHSAEELILVKFYEPCQVLRLDRWVQNLTGGRGGKENRSHAMQEDEESHFLNKNVLRHSVMHDMECE